MSKPDDFASIPRMHRGKEKQLYTDGRTRTVTCMLVLACIHIRGVHTHTRILYVGNVRRIGGLGVVGHQGKWEESDISTRKCPTEAPVLLGSGQGISTGKATCSLAWWSLGRKESKREKLSSGLRMHLEAYAHRINKYHKILPYELRRCINKKEKYGKPHIKRASLILKIFWETGVVGNVYRS